MSTKQLNTVSTGRRYFYLALVVTLLTSVIGATTTQPVKANEGEPPSNYQVFLPLIQKETTESKWQLFQNSEYQYTFEFPSDWIYNTTTSEYEDDPITSNQVTDMHTPNGEFVQVMTWNNDQENLSLLEWYEKYDSFHTSLDNPPANLNAQIAGLDSIYFNRLTLQAPADITAIFNKDGAIFRIWYVANEDGIDYENFLHLLQTFEFDGQTTSDQIPDVTPDILVKEVSPNAIEANTCNNRTDPNGNPYACLCSGAYGNCTWWANYMRPDLQSINFGDAKDWNDVVLNHSKLKYLLPVNGTPELGAIAVFEAYYPWGGIGNLGHVAYVTGHNSQDNTISISQMSCGTNGIQVYNNIPIVSGQISFIHGSPTIFEHSNFQGDWSRFTVDLLNYWGERYMYSEDGNYAYLNDSASSVWIPPDYSVSLFKNNNWQCPANTGYLDNGDLYGSDGYPVLDTRWSNFTSLMFSDNTSMNDAVSGHQIGHFVCLSPGCGSLQSFNSEYNNEHTSPDTIYGMCSGATPPHLYQASDLVVLNNPAPAGIDNTFIYNAGDLTFNMSEIFVSGHLYDGGAWKAWATVQNIGPGQIKTFIASAPMWGDKIGSWYIDGIVYKSTSGNFYNLPGNGFLQTQSFTVSNTGVWLFQGLRYEGIGERFSSNDPNLSNNRIDNDTTTSIKIYTGWYTVVCKNQSYGGRCEFFASSDNDLRNNIVGSNTISSIVVLKNWMFIKGSTATIYIIENGQKKGIPSWKEYLCLGGQPGGYITLLDTIVSLIPTGQVKHCP